MLEPADADANNSVAAGPSWPRWLLLGLLVAAVVYFFASGLADELKWANLQARRTQLKQDVQDHFWWLLAAYFAIYVVVTSLSVPGALPLTLIGGFLFDRWLGTLVISFASTLGATLAFLLTRYLIGAWVQRRWGARLAAINRGVEREGAYYLLTLRLVPAVPFWLINLAMGLTPMRVTTYWWVSQLGMLPATFIFVNAGAELANLESPADILSPTLWIALALLGVLPLAVRWVVKRTRPLRSTANAG